MIDAWTSRTPQSTEYPKVETDGVKKLIDVIKRQGTELGEKTSNLFRTAGITISETLMTFANNVRVEGTLTSTGAANIGGTMNVTGDATFSGNLAVPNGSITNAALQSPVSFDSGKAITPGTSMNLLTTEQTFCTITFTVPPGYTRALVQGQGSVGVVNPTAAVSSVAGRVYIDHPNANPASGARRWQSSAAASDAAVFPVHAGDFAVSGGDTVTVRLTVQGGPSASWGTTQGGATLSAFIFLTR